MKYKIKIPINADTLTKPKRTDADYDAIIRIIKESKEYRDAPAKCIIYNPKGWETNSFKLARLQETMNMK
ncbi:MAG: hypothetical protein IMZ53_05405 [Thermoplasmata archaeon]|nr:hypothetical protein [Thermoplasmata archaeon]